MKPYLSGELPKFKKNEKIVYKGKEAKFIEYTGLGYSKCRIEVNGKNKQISTSEIL